jgi:hypothetical protein
MQCVKCGYNVNDDFVLRRICDDCWVSFFENTWEFNIYIHYLSIYYHREESLKMGAIEMCHKIQQMWADRIKGEMSSKVAIMWTMGEM